MCVSSIDDPRGSSGGYTHDAGCTDVGNSPPNSSGSAAGIVLDEKDGPLQSATVFVAGLLRPTFALSNSEGKFIINGVSGHVELLAYKESDGHPRNFFVFFSNPGERFRVLDVAHGKTVEGVVVQFGPKFALFKLDVKDDAGNRVRFSATLTRPDLALLHPELKAYGDYNVASDEPMFVPAVPLRITVSAEGYAPWHYGDEA